MTHECEPACWSEEKEILREFTALLQGPIRDGQRKRKSGKKVHWTVDPGHVDALQRHLNRWDRGETVDEHSGAHPLTHAAFRCLAIAYQETHEQVTYLGQVDC